MTDTYFCILCEKFLPLDSLVMVQDWRGRRGRGNTATFRDNQAGIVHIVLTEKASATRRKRLEQKVESIVVIPSVPKEDLPQVEEVPPVNAPAPLETDAGTAA